MCAATCREDFSPGAGPRPSRPGMEYPVQGNPSLRLRTIGGSNVPPGRPGGGPLQYPGEAPHVTSVRLFILYVYLFCNGVFLFVVF